MCANELGAWRGCFRQQRAPSKVGQSLLIAHFWGSFGASACSLATTWKENIFLPTHPSAFPRQTIQIFTLAPAEVWAFARPDTEASSPLISDTFVLSLATPKGKTVARRQPTLSRCESSSAINHYSTAVASLSREEWSLLTSRPLSPALLMSHSLPRLMDSLSRSLSTNDA